MTSQMMKQRSKGKIRQAHSVACAALTFEQCLIQILDSIEVSFQKPGGKLHAEKQKLRQFDHHPDRLTLPAYWKIVNNLLERTLTGNPIPKVSQPLFETELREGLKRFEHLLLQITSGHASARQVRWTLCARFFVPWAALRIAFRLRHCQSQQSDGMDCWFIPPVRRSKIGSCFMQILDGQLRHQAETDEAFARQLCQKQQIGDPIDAAKNLCRDFRRYRAGESTATGAGIMQILKGCPDDPTLRAKLVLARAIDWQVQNAIETFNETQALKLVKYFRLSFDHFQHLLRHLDAELPKDDQQAWDALQSQTFTGNTPFEAEHYYPLTEPYLNSLAKKISAELERVGRYRHLPDIPTSKGAFNQGEFAALNYQRLPLRIEEDVQKSDFVGAVAASQSLCPSTSSRPAEAARLGAFFAHLGLDVFRADTVGNGLIRSENEALPVLNEALRLLRLAHTKSRGSAKTMAAICLLRFLLQPHRPKKKEERELARKLYSVVANYYRESNRGGSAAFLHGLLLWLVEDELRALRMMRKAAGFGRASCGEDWIWLLRYAPILAEKLSRKRDQNFFRKLGDHEGVTHGESAPRTRQLLTEWKHRTGTERFKMTFKLFPV